METLAKSDEMRNAMQQVAKVIAAQIAPKMQEKRARVLEVRSRYSQQYELEFNKRAELRRQQNKEQQ